MSYAEPVKHFQTVSESLHMLTTVQAWKHLCPRNLWWICNSSTAEGMGWDSEKYILLVSVVNAELLVKKKKKADLGGHSYPVLVLCNILLISMGMQKVYVISVLHQKGIFSVIAFTYNHINGYKTLAKYLMKLEFSPLHLICDFFFYLICPPSTADWQIKKWTCSKLLLKI